MKLERFNLGNPAQLGHIGRQPLPTIFFIAYDTFIYYYHIL